MPIQFGVIKWIGKLPDQAEIFAGVEMVSHGMFYFMYYIKLSMCVQLSAIAT